MFVGWTVPVNHNINECGRMNRRLGDRLKYYTYFIGVNLKMFKKFNTGNSKLLGYLIRNPEGYTNYCTLTLGLPTGQWSTKSRNIRPKLKRFKPEK